MPAMNWRVIGIAIRLLILPITTIHLKVNVLLS